MNIYNSLLALLLALIWAYPLKANPDWKQAQEALRQKQWPQAIELLQALREKTGPSSELYHNLGLAYWGQGQIGSAVWAWERALYLNPRQTNTQTQLQEAKKQIQAQWLPDETQIQTFALDGQTYPFYLAWFCFALALFLSWLWLKRQKGLGYALGVWVLALGFLVLAQEIDKKLQHKAVVISRFSSLRSGPSWAAQELLALPSGVVLRSYDEQGPWVQVLLPNGLLGWTYRQNLAWVLEPAKD